MQNWVDALTIKTFNEELTSVFPYLYRLVKEKQEQGLTYDDLVAEATCSSCHKDPCECEDTKESTDMFSEFEQQVDELAALNFESDKGDMDHDGEDEPDDQEYMQNKDTAIKKAMDQEEPKKESISKEVVEFIASMYDRETGTFPRGEEGVKIACEKKFGEQAGQFANYVVEKLSSKPFDPEQFGSDGAGAGAGDISKDDEDDKMNELVRIRALAGM
jgi:hypothetical protein